MRIFVGLCAVTTAMLTGLIFLLPTPSSAQSFDLSNTNRRLTVDDPSFTEFNGKVIRAIEITVEDIFPEDELAWVYKTANSLKVNTQKEVVKRELLFAVGDSYDDFLRHESIRALRELRYLRKVHITPVAAGDMVDIKVTVSDTWTLIPQVNYSSGDGNSRRSAGISESNLLGMGKRLEFLVEEDNTRSGFEGVWDDRRVMGTSGRLLLGHFERDDGDRSLVLFGDPFRSLVQKSAWGVEFDDGDTIGRLFEAGSERYIFRQKNLDISARYTFAVGNPESRLFRYSLGANYIDDRFSQATQEDFDDLGLDPNEVSNNIEEVPINRRYAGPVFVAQKINQDFISMNYIDRFDREQDYNLGGEHSASIMGALESLGSLDDAALVSGSRNQGFRFGNRSFLRTEVGFASRYDDEGFVNSLIRGEAKFYSVLGNLFISDAFLGKHTLAVNLFIDYGRELDGDREFLVGGDNVIRGYKYNTFAGDKRAGFNIEDRAHFVDDLFKVVSLGGALFFDAGAASNDPLGRMLQDEIYSNIGVGLRIAFPRSSGGKILRLDIALPLRDGPDGSDRFEPRVIFSGGQLFGSQLRSEALGVEKANVEIGFDR